MKLTEIQCKHSDLEKQLADATSNIAPEQPKNESTLSKIAPRIVTRSEIICVDLTQQNSDIMLVETVYQQTAGAFATLMQEIPPKQLEEGVHLIGTLRCKTSTRSNLCKVRRP